MPVELSQTLKRLDCITDEIRLMEVQAVGPEYVSVRNELTGEYLTLPLVFVNEPGSWRKV